MKPAEGAACHIEIAGHRALCDAGGVLYFADMDLLVVADLHLEKGSSFARRGVLLPPYDSEATLARLEEVIGRFRPANVIGLGDNFHDAGGAQRLSEPLRRRIDALCAGRSWFWVMGNHDPAAPSGLPGRTVEHVAMGDLVFRHEPSRGAVEGEIAGHLHPCARIVRRGRSLRRRCFASDGRRLIMPAFGAFTGSLNILDRAYDGLFRHDALCAYMIGDGHIHRIAGSMLRSDRNVSTFR